jgi:hypothetical protein
MVVPPAHKNQIVFSPSPLDPNMAAINCSVPVFDPANYQLSLWQSSKDITNLAPAIENNRKFLPENTSFNALSDHDMYLRILDLSTKLEKCGDIYGVAQAFIDLRPMAFRADLYRACQLWDTGGLWLDDKIWLTQSFSSFVDIEKDLVVLPMQQPTMDLAADMSQPGHAVDENLKVSRPQSLFENFIQSWQAFLKVFIFKVRPKFSADLLHLPF